MPRHQRYLTQLIALVAVLAALPTSADTIWVEGEKPTRSTMNGHPWYDQVKRDELSGGELISNFHDEKVGEAAYSVRVQDGGEYEFWIRANPVMARLSYKLDGGPWTPIDVEQGIDRVNIAGDGKPDLRFLAWVKAGKVDLQPGSHTFTFRMDSPKHNHGYLDCFVLSDVPFHPKGAMKPEDVAGFMKTIAAANKGWFPFSPKEDPFDATSGFDLRSLNERVAGQGGFIAVKGDQFVHSGTGEPVRFWAVNGPPRELKDREAIRRVARLLAKYGVNLVRVHGAVFDDRGEPDPAKVRHAIDVVECMKAEGIYTHFSIYFPLWMKPKPGTPWLDGYDGTQHPFAALYFNQDFQAKYRTWWKALLQTPSPQTGKPLTADPAVFGVEIINEDSYLFWTFSAENIPDPQLRILEARFGQWLIEKYGSLDKALAAWKGLKTGRDNPAEGRMGFRPLWNMFNEKTVRDQDTTKFLVLQQRQFYQDTYAYIRDLGFKGLINASNWTTASPEVFGPLEKYSYTSCDFIDRHGYFGCNHKGENAAWSIRDGHTYSDRSALRFEAEEPGKARLFAHPAVDPCYDGKPSMISETTFNRPNRFRSEAPLFYAAYGALQDSDAIVHFALDSSTWAVKPDFYMQPWTLMSPAMIGQFPAAALIYRKGLVSPGDVLVQLDLNLRELGDLQGTPLPQDAALDELRLADVPPGKAMIPGGVIDPLVHFAGRVRVQFTTKSRAPEVADVKRWIDRQARTVSATHGQLKLDYGKGVLAINAPSAQGASGALAAAGPVELADLIVSSNLELGHVVAVSLDDRPLAESRRILLQVMTEEKATNFQTEPAGNGVKRITNIGQDPWLIKEPAGTVTFKRSDAAQLRVVPLDHAGYPLEPIGAASQIALQPTIIYYLIQP